MKNTQKHTEAITNILYRHDIHTSVGVNNTVKDLVKYMEANVPEEVWIVEDGETGQKIVTKSKEFAIHLVDKFGEHFSSFGPTSLCSTDEEVKFELSI